MKPSKTQLKSKEELKKAQDLSKKRKIDEITGGQDQQKDRKIRKIEEPARTRKIYEEDKRPYSDIISTEKENKKQRQINQEQIISDSIDSLQEYIDSRREKQQKELLAFGKNREEKQFLENWYQEKYLNREIKIQKVWLQTYKQLKLSR
ncbi:UNKNOWN [Stylonychia lemnae]|uniref:Uncharacterized protein n=1 Tax=Stylonychia lemnae TaxID=5949 RepID=A0A078AE85_STYLE|nr:UNKNOWN [Stylonychia lemnae]|eukprot:CDW80146.1 UNKNOWN [Stylonychia lemnae]